MRKRIRDSEVRKIVDWAARLGFVVEHSSKHGKLRAPGIHRSVIFGYTPSDHRAAENFRHQVIRVARQAGISV